MFKQVIRPSAAAQFVEAEGHWEALVFKRFQKVAIVEPESVDAEQSLAVARPGQKVRITGYQGGRMLRARLLALGLNLGQVVEILQNNRGLIIVGINGGRMALGRGISQKILAEPRLRRINSSKAPNAAPRTFRPRRMVIIYPIPQPMAEPKFPIPAEIAAQPLETLEGAVERLTFADPETHYAVVRLKVKDARRPVTVVGPLAGVQEGEQLHLKGKYEMHPKWGEQFKVVWWYAVLAGHRGRH